MPIPEMAADVAPGQKFYALATVTSSTRINLPSEMLGKFCIFEAEGLDVWIRFGLVGAVSVSKTAVASVASNVLTEDTTSPHLYLPAGTMSPPIRMRSSFTAFAHISTNTTGFLRFGSYQGAYGATASD
jgi:hypothetical protein